MLGNSSIYFDKENRVGQQKLGGGASKLRKGLGGHAGKGSENTVPHGAGSGKKGAGLSLFNANKVNQRAGPLGSRNENASIVGKGKGVALTVSAGKPTTQRKKLGDISNREHGSTGSSGLGGTDGSTKLVGAKLRTPGHGGSKSGSAMKAKKITSEDTSHKKIPAPSVARPAVLERPLDSEMGKTDVPDIEMAMGRLGDEEELLVQRRDEERAAAVMSNAFRTSRPNRYATRERQTQRPSEGALYSSRPRSRPSQEVVALGGGRRLSDNRAGREGTGRQLREREDAEDEKLQRAIAKIIQDDIDEILGPIAGGMGQGVAFDTNDALLEDPAMLVTDADELDSAPVSPLDDSFLSQDLDFDFA